MNQDQYRLFRRLEALGFSYVEACKLRRIERTLRRWAELCCGNGNDHANWAIERDDDGDGKPFMVTHPHGGESYRKPMADRERGALKRLAAIMKGHADFTAYHQGDPRGCALYIVAKKDVRKGEDLNAVYNRGIAIALDTMNTRYTTEPWRHQDGNPRDPQSPEIILAGDGLFVGETYGRTDSMPDGARGRTRNDARANAVRIVACVNACEGLTEPEKQIPALRKLAAECVQLRGTKRELLAALETLVVLVSEREQGNDDLDEDISVAEAAIAKAKGEA